jgi:hypothetical protein
MDPKARTRKALAGLLERGLLDGVEFDVVTSNGRLHADNGWGRTSCPFGVRARTGEPTPTRTTLSESTALCDRCTNSITLVSSSVSTEELARAGEALLRAQDWLAGTRRYADWGRLTEVSAVLEGSDFTRMTFLQDQVGVAVAGLAAAAVRLGEADATRVSTWARELGAEPTSGAWELARVRGRAREELYRRAVVTSFSAGELVHAPNWVLVPLKDSVLESVSVGRGELDVVEAAGVLAQEGMDLKVAVEVARAL